MIKIEIPGIGEFNFKYLVLDYNGTIAADGELLPGVKEKLKKISSQIKIYVITADTNGSAAQKLRGLPVELKIIPRENQIQHKRDFVKKLGNQNVFAIGNGMNDVGMLEEAAIGVILIQKEGAATKALLSSDIVSYSIICSLGYLMYPKRLIATMRS